MSPISRACRISSSRAPRASPPTAAIPASTRSPCRDRASSRSCNSRPDAICARPPFAPGRRAARMAAATDNRAIAAEMVRLRAERARLLGYETYAHYRLADTMAKTPQAALDLLESVWTPGVASARKDEEALQAIAASEGGNFKLAPWDWRYLVGEAAQGRVRFRRGRAQALSAARPHDRGRLLRREPSVRRSISPSASTSSSIIPTFAHGK